MGGGRQGLFPAARPVIWLAKYWKPILPVALLVVASLVFAFCRPKPQPIPAPEQKSLDSLKGNQPAFDSAHVASVRAETVFVKQAAKAAHVDTISARRADSIGRVADSLQRVAEAQHDTTSAWKAVADARSAQVVEVTVSRDSARSALASEHAARLLADTRASVTDMRLAATTDLNARLAKDVQNGGQCTWLFGTLRCPSRKEAVVGGIALGVAALEGARLAATGKP